MNIPGIDRRTQRSQFHVVKQRICSDKKPREEKARGKNIPSANHEALGPLRLGSHVHDLESVNHKDAQHYWPNTLWKLQPFDGTASTAKNANDSHRDGYVPKNAQRDQSPLSTL